MTEELNRRHNLATMPTINNNGESYIVPFDIYKEGYDAYDISNWFKGRVGDNGTPFGIRWYKHGQLMDVTGMRPFIEGQVGDYTIDDSDPDDPKINMDSEASNVHVVGEVNDCQEYGVAIYRLINQAMPQSGIFYGKIGVMGTDIDGTTVMSSVDVVFKVLAGHMNMIGARKFYVSELEKALIEFQAKIKKHDQDYATLVEQHNQEFHDQAKRFNDDTQKVIDDARNSYETETKNAHDSLDALKAQIQANRDEQETLSQHLAGTEQQIGIHDVVTRHEFAGLSNQLSQQVAQMRQSGLEFYKNVDELKSKYPTGANKLCVTLDNSHQWIYDYINNTWEDTGAFNYGTLDPKLLYGLYSHNSDNLITNSDFNTTNEWYFGENNGSNPNVSITSDNAINGSNVLVLSNVKNGNSNTGIWAQSSRIPASNRKYISLGVRLNYQQDAGDNGSSFIQINWIDYQDNRTIWNSVVTATASDRFDKHIWENIAIPAGTKEFFIAFGLDGSGTLRILQPQINDGITLSPYSGSEVASNLESTTRDLMANNPLHNWLIHNSGDSSITELDEYYLNSKLFKISSAHNTTDNWPFLRSPKLAVQNGANLTIDLTYNANFITGKSNAYIEVEQYAFQDGDSDNRLNIKRTINVQNDLKTISLADFKLDPSTKYITVTVGLNGAGEIIFSKPNVYYDFSVSQLNQKIKLLNNKGFNIPIYDWQLYSWGGANNYIYKCDYDVVYNAMPTLRLKNVASNCGIFLQSESIPTEKADTAVIDIPVFVRNDSEAILEAVQLDQNNIERVEQFFLDKNDAVTDKRIVINLFDDTKAIKINITANDLGDLNVAAPSIELINTQIKDLNPLMWTPERNGLGLIPTKQKIDGTETLVVSQTNKQDRDYWLFAQSSPLVVNTDKISLKFVGYTQINDAKSNTFIELDEFRSFNDAHNGKAITKQNLYFNGKTQEFVFENISLNKDTKFIILKAVVQNNATIGLSSFKVYLSSGIDDFIKISKLPQMDLLTNGTITADWQKAQFKYLSKDKQLNGYLQYAIQGSSSSRYPKKNLKVKLYKSSDFKDKLKVQFKTTWKPESKFNIKANWIDATQSRNLANARAFAKATEITPISNDGINLAASPNMGQMDGFPIELYINGQYYGLMTLNIKKTDKSFGMDSNNPKHEVIDCAKALSKTFGDPSQSIDGINYETNIQNSASDELKNNFKQFIEFLNNSTDEEFKTNLKDHIDVKSVINAYLWGIFSMMQDYETKSIMLCTWDAGKTYYLTLYDMDSTWNLWWNGSSLNQEPSRWTFDLSHPANDFEVIQNTLYNRLWKLFKSEIKAQWQYLRANVWRNDQVIESFKKFMSQFTSDSYKRDQSRWPDIPSKKITDFEQIQQSIITRGNAMDNFMEHLTDSQPTSPAPQPTTPQAQPASGTTPANTEPAKQATSKINPQPTTPQAQPTEPKQ